jgi:Domain of unknown function (DUF5916)
LSRSLCRLALLVPFMSYAAALAADIPATPTFTIARTALPIHIDGNLDDEAWKSALRIDTWYETNPGDNTQPAVRNVGWLTYDDQALYAAFEFDDPDPGRIRAPYFDRDNLGGDIDYGGLLLSPRADGRTGLLLLATPRGIQYDAVNDDANGSEDSAPDFFWTSAARITDKGWVLELRVPFASLRYPPTDPATWRMMMYRNYPRAFRYQFFSARLPQGGNCFVCNATPLAGLTGLPKGGHLVLAPYANARRNEHAPDGPGFPLSEHKLEGDVGLDVKWTPNAQHAVDGTVNPDFSQIESDVAQIGVNERFALFYPEKRPFFLEGVELLSTPIQAAYTRTITSPRWGVRGTGKFGSTAYTSLVTEDDGGGSVILPGSNGSDYADQDFRSWVGVTRLRRDFGRSFVSVLGTARQIRGGGFNQVLGPDFQWRIGQHENITGQLLFSRSHTPNRPDLATEWDGRELDGHAALLNWAHNTKHVDAFGQYQDFGDGFRADDGFVPQVGFRETYGESGYTFRPKGFVRRLRTFVILDRSTDRASDLLNRQISVGAGMDLRFNSFARVRWAADRVRAGSTTLPRQQLLYELRTSPSRRLTQIQLTGFLGEQIDFEGARTGRGGSVLAGFTVRPTDHLDIGLLSDHRWLNVPTGSPSGTVDPRGSRQRLFSAQVERVRATYTFNSRSFLRAIVQYVETQRDPTLYPSEVQRRDANLNASALLAYKLNWQTVLFLGYGDQRALDERVDQLKPADTQLFIKLSYAFQR